MYGFKVPLSPWHATRYILMAVPFLIYGLPLWVHRLWQALFLWIGVTALSSWLLVRRLHLGNKALVLVGPRLGVYLSLARPCVLLFAGLRYPHSLGCGAKASLALVNRSLGCLVLGWYERRELVSGSGPHWPLLCFCSNSLYPNLKTSFNIWPSRSLGACLAC